MGWRCIKLINTKPWCENECLIPPKIAPDLSFMSVSDKGVGPATL